MTVKVREREPKGIEVEEATVRFEEAEVIKAEKRNADTGQPPRAKRREDEDHDWEDLERLISTIIAMTKRCKVSATDSVRESDCYQPNVNAHHESEQRAWDNIAVVEFDPEVVRRARMIETEYATKSHR